MLNEVLYDGDYIGIDLVMWVDFIEYVDVGIIWIVVNFVLRGREEKNVWKIMLNGILFYIYSVNLKLFLLFWIKFCSYMILVVLLVL